MTKKLFDFFCMAMAAFSACLIFGIFILALLSKNGETYQLYVALILGAIGICTVLGAIKIVDLINGEE